MTFHTLQFEKVVKAGWKVSNVAFNLQVETGQEWPILGLSKTHSKEATRNITSPQTSYIRNICNYIVSHEITLLKYIKFAETLHV